MNKPLTIMHEDFKERLTDLINSSRLPAFVIEYVLHDYLNEIRMIAQNQYKSDKAMYEKSLKEESVNTIEDAIKDGD